MFIMYRFLVQNTDPWGQQSERDGWRWSVTEGGGLFFFSFGFSWIQRLGAIAFQSRFSLPVIASEVIWTLGLGRPR